MPRDLFGTLVPVPARSNGCALHTLDATTLAFETPFSHELVDALKRSIPHHARRWDKARGAWLVEATYGHTCVDLAERYFSARLRVPNAQVAPAKQETRLVKLEYLGRTRDRGDDGVASAVARSASGFADGDWSLVFPETVLREWFKSDDSPPGNAPTLYATLGVAHDVSNEDVRAAYRRLAKRWHPDVSSDPDAPAQFRALAEAYDVLREPRLRRRYDAGLQFERDAQAHEDVYRERFRDTSYRAPLTCGYVLCEGTWQLGRFLVSTILEWQDIQNDQGQIMVSSWNRRRDTFTMQWVDA